MMVTEVAGPAAGQSVGIGGVLGSNTVRTGGPIPNPKMVMISPGAIVPCRKLAEFNTAVICGVGPYIRKCASGEAPPPGVGVVTVRRSSASEVSREAGTVTSIAVSLTGTDVRGVVAPTVDGVPLRTPAALSKRPAGSAEPVQT